MKIEVDYYPFEMEQPNRQYTNSEVYRYGFNGKENDREWGTASLTQDYGFRLYNPAIAKFLSVDPLAPSYPWNSTYAFAEGDAIRCIDLDGLEKLDVNIISPIGINNCSCGNIECKKPSLKLDKPGEAEITIKLQYIIVTKDMGSFTNPTLIDPIEFSRLYDKGDITIKASSLPDKKSSKLTEATEKNIKAGNYYNVKIDYQYSVINQANISIKDAMQWYLEDPHGRGIILTTLNSSERDILVNMHSYSLPMSIDLKIKDLSEQVEQEFANDKSLGGAANAGSPNIIVMVPQYFNIPVTTMFKHPTGANATQLVVHEAGHNSAEVHKHKTGNYEYTQRGLSSNQGKYIFPILKNTLNIINDVLNSLNIKP